MEKENYEILWEQTILPELEKTVSSISFATHVSQIKPVDIKDNKIIFCTSSQLFADTISNQATSGIGGKIREALLKCTNYITDFAVVVAKDRDEYLKQLDEADREIIENRGSPINPKFTFDSFVVGSSNELIYAAAKAVAENPGDAYNPLFIHGGTGLGKTHILMAIANYLRLHKPRLNVLYATCEQFTNQLIESISKGKGAGAGTDFRKKYRNVDVLLIDDVQFLAKKQGIQTEFFHTFNELVMQNKQVVLTSDRPPKEIEVLEERLRTRFEGGLLADVQPPDLETRIAILKRKSEEQKCVVDIKVLGYIAEMDEGDIRSLIGKLTKVVFASKLHERPITIDLVNEALKESASEKQEALQAEDIINCVCNFYKITKSDMLGKKKNKEFAFPRQIAMYLILDMMNLPKVTVANIFKRDHATVIYAGDKIAEQMKTDNRLSVEINDIRKMLLKQ
ncbi:MAG: chromosomal replication initiator protein DnaA [Clostridiales bacterium]|nr:chromosomal replication initiator protein DnaA [Clostridiales bacterium]